MSDCPVKVIIPIIKATIEQYLNHSTLSFFNLKALRPWDQHSYLNWFSIIILSNSFSQTGGQQDNKYGDGGKQTKGDELLYPSRHFFVGFFFTNRLVSLFRQEIIILVFNWHLKYLNKYYNTNNNLNIINWFMQEIWSSLNNNNKIFSLW